MTFDRSLSLIQQVEETVRKAKKKMNLIRVVANTSWGWCKKDLIRSGQHTSVMILTMMLVDGSPRSVTAS